MNTIVKFENTPINIQKINGATMFELYSVGMALGYARGNGKSSGEHGVHPNNKKLFPYKSRIDKVCENAEIKPVLHGANTFINESQLYDFMLEARTDKCRAFRKWLTNEVLPELNHTGSYSMPKKNKQLLLYNYFDKTYKSKPVLSSADLSYFTNINHSTVDWYARTYLTKDTDYYFLNGEDLRSYKQENPQVSRLASAVVVFTQSGFDKLCKAYGIEVEMPKLFIPENQSQAKSCLASALNKVNEIARHYSSEMSKKEMIKDIIRMLEEMESSNKAEPKQIQSPLLNLANIHDNYDVIILSRK